MKKINHSPFSLVNRALIKWSLSGILLILSPSCSKEVPVNDNNEPLYALDKEVYFTIQTASGIYTDYGYYQINTANTSAGQIFNFQKTLDSSGVPVINIQILFTNEFVYGGGGWFGSTPPSHLYLGNCQGEIDLTKSGTEITGKYQTHPENDLIILINSSTQSQEKLALDTSGMNFSITNEGRLSHGGDFVEGNFSFNLFSYINGPSTITAKGSFRLPINQ